MSARSILLGFFLEYARHLIVYYFYMCLSIGILINVLT